MAIHPNKKFFYAVNEGKASVSAFAIDEKTGNLTFLNSQPSQGGAPCHLVVDPTGKNVLAANYSGGSCICISIEADGKLGKATFCYPFSTCRCWRYALGVTPNSRRKTSHMRMD